MCVIASRFKSSLRVDAYRILVRRAVVAVCAVQPSPVRPSRPVSATRIAGSAESSRSADRRDRRDRSTRSRDRSSVDRAIASIDRSSIDVRRSRRSSIVPRGVARAARGPHNDVVRVGDVCARDDGRARRVDGARAREDVGDDDGRARDDRARRRGAAKRARDGPRTGAAMEGFVSGRRRRTDGRERARCAARDERTER